MSMLILYGIFYINYSLTIKLIKLKITLWDIKNFQDPNHYERKSIKVGIATYKDLNLLFSLIFLFFKNNFNLK